MQIMASIITYVKVCLLLYYLVVNAALRAMPIRNMYHDANLVGMLLLTLNFIFWIKGVVFCKIHNWQYGPNGKVVPTFSVLLIMPSRYMHMLNILLGFLVELHKKSHTRTYFHENKGHIRMWPLKNVYVETQHVRGNPWNNNFHLRLHQFNLFTFLRTI